MMHLEYSERKSYMVMASFEYSVGRFGETIFKVHFLKKLLSDIGPQKKKDTCQNKL